MYLYQVGDRRPIHSEPRGKKVWIASKKKREG